MSAAVSSSVLGAVRRRRLRRFGVPFVVGAGVAGLALVAGVLAPLPSAAAASPGLPAPGATVMVSTDPTGAVAADEKVLDASVSGDGRFVAFSTAASNVVSAPSGGYVQIYVKDMKTGTSRLVTHDFSDAGKGADSDCYFPSISADGRYVAFQSSAHNLDSSVGFSSSTDQIFVADLAPGGDIRLVSRNAAGTSVGNNDSQGPQISADGTWIAFESVATDLVVGATSSARQVYRTMVVQTTVSSTELVSLQDASRTGSPDVGNQASFSAAISADGSVVAFASVATNLTHDSVSGVARQIFVHDHSIGSTRLVSASATGAEGGYNSSHDASISADGSLIAFTSTATNISTAPFAAGIQSQVYLRDMSGPRASELMSINMTGSAEGDGGSILPAISADGRVVAFVSVAKNLAPNDGPVDHQAYVRMRSVNTTAIVSAEQGDPRRGAVPGLVSNVGISADGNFVHFVTRKERLSDVPATGKDLAYLRNISAAAERIGGADRFVVSAAISAKTFDSNVPVAYVASGTGFPDALSASAAAGKQGGPVLLVTKDSIPGAIATELGRLKPQRIVVIGGTNTISGAVQTELEKYSTNVSRVDGADRYVVSAKLSEKTFARVSAPVAYVASGTGFPDALSGSAAAGQLGGPVLLTAKDSVPEAVKLELRRLHPALIIVLGGANTVSDGVVLALKAIAPTTRTAGADRFAVSAAVSTDAFPGGAETVYVASGAVFPDALSGSAAAIADKGPVLLVTKDEIPGAIDTELKRLEPSRIVVLGGVNTVSDAVLTKLAEYITG